MKLLIFDKENSSHDTDSISLLNQSLKDFTISLTTDVDDAKILYESSKFEIIIIDFTTKEGEHFLEYIVKNNSKQKVITIGFELTNSEKLGCDYCEANYLRRRLVKPINIIDLYKTITNFDNIKCEYKNKFNDLEVILKQLLYKYQYFKFDKIEWRIYARENGSIVLKQYLELLNDLNLYNIKYEVIDDKTLKIL